MKRYLRGRDEAGFTLVELLVVIIILGILAAVVIFATGNLGDRGQNSACRTDRRTLTTAEEAYYNRDVLPAGAPDGVADGTYATMTELDTAGFLDGESTLHTIAVDNAANPPTFTVNFIAGGACDPA